MSRRRFLQTAGLIGAGLALGVDTQAQQAGSPSQSSASHGPQTTGPANSPFVVKFDSGAISSLKRAQDKYDTDYVRANGRLGDANIRYRYGSGDWQWADTSTLDISSILNRTSDSVTEYALLRQVSDGAKPTLAIETRFIFQSQALLWSVALKNLASQPVEIGDLAIPLPMNGLFRRNQPATAAVLKHGFVSGHSSHIFWMRSNSAGPYLTFMPLEGTHLEYWDAAPPGGYRVYIHSAAAGAEAKERGCHWRQPNTSLTLAPAGQTGASQTYGFRYDWAEDYDAVRQTIVDNGLIDVHVVPGMTVPSDLFAQFALRTKQKIHSVDAEFPDSTKIKYLGAKGDYHIYEAHFSKLGENELTVQYGNGRHMFLEFFVTEPLETVIKKRAAFTAGHQFRDPSKWYNGLLAEWNMQSGVQLGPDNYDKITGWRIYEVTCDDPGLSKPAYLASKNAEHPLQSEVEALDYYIQHFVWGGLQQTTEEPYPYAIYGIPDWKTNRESADPGRNGRTHIWRCYDYPHMIVMYFSMYRVAKNNPQIQTTLTAKDYLQRAAGTAIALFTVPMEIEKWSGYETGYYNEVVIPDLILELEAAGMSDQAGTLRKHWERKVQYFINDGADLFGSEYPFDSTGFESTHALAKYAMQHTQDPASAGDLGVTRKAAEEFLQTQMAANIFCRGWLEPAYYLLGSDYRAGGGNSYTLTYMSQMGGWGVLDYGLNFASDPYPYIRLGYASYLSAWALVNSGTQESNYGFWYPGEGNDGGAGGGFEPAPYGMTWLDQPHHRGSWYYSCEINLGYCGALRAASTVLADDPIFGRFCYGGDLTKSSHGVKVVPKDGVRRRFHAKLDKGALHMEMESGRFATGQPIALKDDLSEIRFTLESDNPGAHLASLNLFVSVPGQYTVKANGQEVASMYVAGKRETATLNLPVPAGGQPQEFVISRSG